MCIIKDCVLICRQYSEEKFITKQYTFKASLLCFKQTWLSVYLQLICFCLSEYRAKVKYKKCTNVMQTYWILLFKLKVWFCVVQRLYRCIFYFFVHSLQQYFIFLESMIFGMVRNLLGENILFLQLTLKSKRWFKV